jgi:quinone-modifying oxidoreductase subunit QmoA
VNENCTCCGDCAEASQTEIDSDFDFGMKKVKGAYLPFEMAFPARFVISPEIIGSDDAQRCKDACKYDAVDLEMEAKTLNFNVGAMVWATGWEPYDANQNRQPRLRSIPEHHHQYDDGAAGLPQRADQGQNPAPFGRESS